MKRKVKPTITLALALLGLNACAGTPPDGQQASAAHHGKCEHVTGSMLCGNDDQDSLSSLSSPSASTPASNLSQGARGAGR